MWPEVFRLGSFALPTYGLFMGMGFVAAVLLLQKRAPAFGVSSEVAADFAVYVLLAGLAGAKLLLVIVEWPHYVSSFQGLKDLVSAGGVFYGGLIGAVVVGFSFLRVRGIPAWPVADAAAPAIALGQAFGRMGCFFAGCCWGDVCHKPWAVTFTSLTAERNVGVPLNVPLHPVQLYEAAGTLLLCVLLVVFDRKKFSGETFARYLIGYAVLRGTLEFFRGDPRGSVGDLLSTSQFIALCGVAAGIAILLLRRKKLYPA